MLKASCYSGCSGFTVKTLLCPHPTHGDVATNVRYRGLFRRVYFIGRSPHRNDASYALNFDFPAFQSYNIRSLYIHLFPASVGRIIRFVMSFQDTAVIAFLVLLLFGPKKLPELARQLGKLMGEFRRASNEFRMQMEDELRIAEQADQQKKIADMQAAAPVTSALPETTTEVIPIATGESSDEVMHENTIAPPVGESWENPQPESAPKTRGNTHSHLWRHQPDAARHWSPRTPFRHRSPARRNPPHHRSRTAGRPPQRGHLPWLTSTPSTASELPSPTAPNSPA